MDTSVYHSLNDFAYRHAWFGDGAKFFADIAIFVVLGLLVVAWLLRGRWGGIETRRAVVAAGCSAVLALVANVIISHIYDRTRPFVHLHHAHLLVSHGRDASFPSDHMSAAIGIAAALLLRRRLAAGWAALVVAILIGVGRVAVGVHYPTDILGSVVVGTVAALILFWRPLRALMDRISDAVSGIYERGTARPAAQPR